MMLGTIQPNRPIDMQTMYLDFFAAGQLKQRRIRTGRGPPQKHCQNQTHFFWVWTYCQQYGVLVASWACVCDKLVLFASNRTLGLQVWTQRNLGWHVFFFWKGKIACINCSATSCKSSALVDQVNSRGATSTVHTMVLVIVIVLICILDWKTKVSTNRHITCLFVRLFVGLFAHIIPSQAKLYLPEPTVYNVSSF